MSDFIRVQEVCEILQIKTSEAYKIMRELNKEREELGYRTIRGRISRSYLERRYFGVENVQNANISKKTKK